MIEHVWSVLCEQALQNPKNGSMSHINTLDILPIKKVNKETGELALEPFLIATKWKKNTEENVKLFIKIEMLGESVEKKGVFGSEEITLGEEATIAALNIDVTQMVIKADSKFHAFEVMYKYNKQRKYRSAAVLPFSIQKLTERKDELEKEE